MFRSRTKSILGRTLLSCALFLGGCTQGIPKSPLSLQERIENSRALIEERERSASSMSSREKADYFEKRILSDFRSDNYLVSDTLTEKGEVIGDIEATSLFLSSLAFKHQVTGEGEDLVKKVIDSIIEFDKSNGLDGQVPFKVRYQDGRRIMKEDTHSNAYTMLFHAYSLAYQSFDNQEIKDTIKNHAGLISEYFLRSNLKLKDSKGNPIESSDLSPSLFKGSRSRMLDGLVFCEFMLNTLDKSHKNYGEILKVRKKMQGAGYLNAIQGLEFKFLNFRLPSHGTDWLNSMRLYTLCINSDNEKYRSALKRFYKSQRKEHNPLFNSFNALVFGDEGEAGKFARKYIDTYPLEPDNSEVLNIGNGVKTKLIPQIIKNRTQRESTVPLPYYQRPLDNQIGKRNPFVMDSHKSVSKKVALSGIDYLHMYWAAEAAGFYKK